jgi:hypothetical protein
LSGSAIENYPSDRETQAHRHEEVLRRESYPEQCRALGAAEFDEAPAELSTVQFGENQPPRQEPQARSRSTILAEGSCLLIVRRRMMVNT